ncbi:hypothetical protein F5B21DRAFT_515729 [Xylaria acuta]|nr:hypothetical protein F5B21DRAFT_515729 [Xylaria acuta]
MFPHQLSRKPYNRQRPPGLGPDTEPSIGRAPSRYSMKAYKNDRDEASPSEDESDGSDQRRGSEEPVNEENRINESQILSDSWNRRGSKASSAIPFTSARQKASTNIKVFIPDVISRRIDPGPNCEIRTVEDGPETSSDHWNQKGSKQKASTNLQITISDDRSRALRSQPAFGSLEPKNSAALRPQPAFGSLDPSNSALYDYLMTHMPPEQRDNKRPMMARQQQQLGKGYEYPYEPSTSQAFLTRGNDPEPNPHHVDDDDRSLSNALHIIRENLNIQDESLLTMETLLQLLHRVSWDKGGRTYLDPPQWLAGANSTKEALVGNLPISNIICIIYRDYDGSRPSFADLGDENMNGDMQPKHSSEVIEVINEGLATAIDAFSTYFEFDVDDTAPTKETMLSRNDLSRFSETLDSTQRQQFQMFLDYILTEYEAEYKLVDDMISEGKITYGYIKYLFKPGDVVVQGNHQDSRGYLCTTWLGKGNRANRAKPGFDLQSYDLQVQCWQFDGVFSRKGSILSLQVDIKDPSEKIIDDMDIRPLEYLHPPEKKTISSDSMDALRPTALEQNDPPNDKFIYLMPLTIKGFNLKRKKWLDLEVDKIGPVIWNKQAFKHLVIKEKTKRLIQALISNQIETEKSTDLITGKGNGLIMLLHGGPGTGKTLTAESVAEIAEKPLYPVTCGDIGTEPEQVENYLESVLHIGKTWGCVVLLDEADVFLEQRSLEDLQRNALVSVFLRVLEYYDGILVLTSNRVGTFDEAFKSRIQLALHYKNLSEHQRTQIWGNFLSRLEEINEVGIDFVDLKDNIEELAKHKLNGREIRNVITTARQYARWERQQPNMQHIQLDYKMMKEVIETAGEFDRYIEKLNGGNTYDQLAEDDGLRLEGGV